MEVSKMEIIQELQTKIIRCKAMVPAAKSFAGMILFKVEHDISLDSSEKNFYEDLHLFLNVSSQEKELNHYEKTRKSFIDDCSISNRN